MTNVQENTEYRLGYKAGQEDARTGKDCLCMNPDTNDAFEQGYRDGWQKRREAALL
jgi:hypothetical protein